MANESKEYFVGVDLGGTKILAGVFDNKLKLIGKNKMSTKAERGSDKVMERIARCVRDALDECDLTVSNVKAVGIGTPGTVDADTGRVIFSPNLDGWKDVPLKKDLEKELGAPVFVGNDANICTLAVFEHEFKGKPANLVGIFIGTGVGGGLVINGKLYFGHNHTAGEIGHTSIDLNGPKCGCGNRGCLEAFASRTAIFKKILAAVKEGQKTLLTDMLGAELEDMRSGDLRKAIRKGDKFVEKIVNEAAEYAGIGVANIINLLNPEVIVLGGGVIEALGDEMMPIIVKAAKERSLPGTSKGVEIVASELGDDAGITGAAVLARHNV
jgi:glucokinase